METPHRQLLREARERIRHNLPARLRLLRSGRVIRARYAALIGAVLAAACAGTAFAADGPRPAQPIATGDPIPGGVALAADGAQFASGRLLVRFQPGTRTAIRFNALDHAGVARALRSYELVPGLQLVQLVPGQSVPAAAAALASNPAVAYAEPDLQVPVSVIPNDTSYGQQWGLAAIGAPAAWDRTTGSTAVTVGVLDTGIQMNHPDLAANIWTNAGETPGNGVDDDANGFVDDVHGWDFWNNDNDPSDDLAPQVGHGTHVAGIIGATGNNATGIAGVNWTVQLMPLKICQNSLCSTSAEIAALDYAANEGVQVVNSSFGGPTELQSEKDAIEAAGAAGVIDVASAGNAGSDNDVAPTYPASHPLDNIISVAATTSAGDMASFSNFGAASVDLGAPGQDIFSTYPTSTYNTLSGTSMAAPHVTGGAAILLAQHALWTRQQVLTRLISTVHPLSALAGNVASCGELDLALATDTSLADRALVCAKRTGTGAGSVSSSPAGIACGTTCVAGFAPGTSVTLTATTTSGSTFTGWRGPCTGTGACVVNASTATTATAVFRRSGSPSGWNQSMLQRPAPRDPFLPNYGRDLTFYNVSLSESGNVRARTIFNPGPQVGGNVNCNYDTSDTGGIYLSRRNAAGAWTDEGALTAPLVGSDAAARWTNCFSFGSVTKLSGDGNRLLASQDMAHPPGPTNTYRCAAFVFVHTASGWGHEATLLPPGIGPTGSANWDGCGYFGIGGAISRDGSRVAVLGHNGHVYADVFVRGAGGWTYEQRLDTPACGDQIAPPYIAMSADGSRVLLGDPGCDTGTPFLGGRVHAFTRSGSTWTLTQTLNPPENLDRLQVGATIAMSSDGKTAALSSELGPAYVYERGSSWQLRRKLDVGTDAALNCPAVVRTGSRVVCAAYETVGFNRAQGALYAFDRATGGWSAAAPTTLRAFASDGLAGDILGRAGSFGWPSVGVTESGTVIDAPMSALNIALGYYPHDRIGYEFVTPDPIGKLVAAPTQARAASTGNTLTFTYTAATALSGGTLSLTVPPGWSAPSTASGDPGFTTASTGILSIASRTITVTGLTLAKGQTLAIVYGSGAPGATAPAAGGDQTWPVSTRVAAGEPFVSLVSPPVVRVLSLDGAGTMTASPASVAHGAAGKTITLTFTAAAGGLSAGSVTVDVPVGWSDPSTTGSAPGFTKASVGAFSVVGRTVTVSGLNLAAGQKLVITYGAKTGGGPGATAPATAVGAQPWQAMERSSASGVMTSLAVSPSVTVT